MIAPGTGRTAPVACRPMLLRRGPALLVALLLALSSSPAGATGEEGGDVVVRVGLRAAEGNLNPFVAPRAEPVSHDLTMLVYDSLFWSQSRVDPEPWLATSAVPSADFRTWTVTVRDDVTWHDGEPFEADDVAFTFERFAADGGDGRYGPHVAVHPRFESATVVDARTVELTFATPAPLFTQVPGGDLPILPHHLWEGVTDPRADVATLPVGTGPFRMVDLAPDGSFQLDANPDYFLGPPAVDRLTFSIVADDDAAFAALADDQLDLVARNVPVSQADMVANAAGVDTIGGTRNETVYLLFDVTAPGVSDPQVRRAISLGLDVDRLLDEVEGGSGRLGTDTWTHPNSVWTRNPAGRHTSDRAAAEQLLEASGYTLGPDGVRISPDGQPLALTLGVDATRTSPVRTAGLVVQQLAEIGVSVTVEPLDPTAFDALRGVAGAEPPTVDLVIDEVESHAHDDPDHLFFLFHSTAGGPGPVFGKWASPEFDAAVTDALDEPLAPKIDLLHRAQDVLADEVPVIALFYPAGRIAYRPDVYDGWISDQGHGVFTKRSLLAPYADAADPGDSRLPPSALDVDSLDDEGDGGRSIVDLLPLALLAVGVVAVGSGLFVAFRQTPVDDEAEPDDEMVDA